FLSIFPMARARSSGSASWCGGGDRPPVSCGRSFASHPEYTPSHLLLRTEAYEPRRPPASSLARVAEKSRQERALARPSAGADRPRASPACVPNGRPLFCPPFRTGLQGTGHAVTDVSGPDLITAGSSTTDTDPTSRRSV